LLLQDTFKCIWIVDDVMFHKMYSFVSGLTGLVF